MIDFIKEGLTWLAVDLVRNEIQHIIPAMDPEEYPERSGMKYYLDLQLPEFPMSSTFETMITLEGREKPPISSGGALVYEGCSFRLEELLAGQLSISLPLRNSTLLSAVATLTTKYRIHEIVEPALLDKYQPTRTAMRAGLALRDFVGYEHTFFSRYQAEKKQFLTWHPNNKTVSANQREYLYFLLNMNPLPETIKLRIRITRQNGTKEILTKATVSGLRAFQVVCCQVGPAVLALDANVVKYEAWLSDQDDQRFTEVRIYNVDREPQAYERFLLFSNSFGAFDTLRLTGKASEETDVIKNTSRKEREAGKGLDFSELEVISVSENSGVKVSTGYFKNDATTYQDYLRELVLSEVILMETPFGFEAMNLITSNLEYKKDRPGLVERTFELQRTYSDKNYSRMQPAEKQAARSTKWIGVSSKALLDAFGKRTGYLSYERLQKVYVDDGTKVIPYAIKPNIPGDPDYIIPMLESSIAPGSTPYPSAIISRAASFKRNNCDVGYLGSTPTLTIPAGTYGGEGPGDADELAELAFSIQNTQEYANSNGVCELNIVPLHYALLHKIPMDINSKVEGTPQWGPVVDVRVNGVVVIPNTTGHAPPTLRLSDTTYLPGLRTLVFEVEYGNEPFYPCKIKIPTKGVEIYVNKAGFYILDNVQVNSSDEPLTIEIVNP